MTLKIETLGKEKTRKKQGNKIKIGTHILKHI
jgi:hypothetical protein